MCGVYLLCAACLLGVRLVRGQVVDLEFLGLSCGSRAPQISLILSTTVHYELTDNMILKNLQSTNRQMENQQLKIVNLKFIDYLMLHSQIEISLRHALY